MSWPCRLSQFFQFLFIRQDSQYCVTLYTLTVPKMCYKLKWVLRHLSYLRVEPAKSRAKQWHHLCKFTVPSLLWSHSCLFLVPHKSFFRVSMKCELCQFQNCLFICHVIHTCYAFHFSCHSFPLEEETTHNLIGSFPALYSLHCLMAEYRNELTVSNNGYLNEKWSSTKDHSYLHL